jgi:hypothetical protein
MPIFKKGKIEDNSNNYNELYKIFMNEKYDVEILFNFYWKNFVSDPKILENHPLIGKRLLKYSDEYFIVSNKNKNQNINSDKNSQLNSTENPQNLPINKILYKNLIPLDLSSDNYLFTKFLKFHLGFVKFSQWYQPNDFNKLEVNETIMKDYLTKSLLVCLDKTKKDLKEKLNTVSDFKLISNTCIKERLTLYNFMIEFDIDPSSAKEFINVIYMKAYRNKSYVPDLSSETKNINVDSLLKIYSKEKSFGL